MRVLMVCPRYPPAVGGIENHVAELSRRLVRRGHDVEVHTTGPPVGQEDSDGLRVVRHAALAPGEAYYWSGALEKAVRARASAFDVIHAHGVHAFPALHAFRARGSRPFVFTPHYNGGGHTAFRSALFRLYRLAVRPAFRHADLVIAVSEWEAGRIREDFGRGGSIVVPNGIDVSAIASVAPFPAGDSPPVVVAGRLERYKNVETAVAAVAGHPELRLDVLGSGPDAPRLQRVASELGAGERVQFRGRVSASELIARLKSARCVVSLSSHECFGMMVLEAVAAGAPVIASELPAHRELASRFPGRIELLTQATPESLRQAVLRAPSREVPGNVREYDWDRIAETTVTLYAKAAGGRA